MAEVSEIQQLPQVQPPQSVVAIGEKHVAAIEDAMASAGLTQGLDEQTRAALLTVCGYSDFAATVLKQQPHLLTDDAQDLLWSAAKPNAFRTRVQEALQTCGNDDVAIMRVLRRLRRSEMVRIAWRDLLGLAPTHETLQDLTDMANAFVSQTLAYITPFLHERFGIPRSRATGREQKMIVLGMGKLGGFELNYSSDIDLIFIYPEAGETDGRKVLDNGQFFTRLGQRLIKLLNETTGDGFVFRVDMRLRPFGNSGPLAISFDALETYYVTQGREWERYAMIKARPMTGQREDLRALRAVLAPFVYRRYLDYGVFESLRELKMKISAEVARKGMAQNIKLGAGGIREIEFIGQAFQLVRGGRERALRKRGIVPVLTVCEQLGLIESEVVVRLHHAYELLRRVENRLQMLNDQQTHTLPEDELTRTRIALASGFADWESLQRAIDVERAFVREQFEDVFRVEQQDEPETDVLDVLWQSQQDVEEMATTLHYQGFKKAEAVAKRLIELRDGRFYAALSKRGTERLDRLLPKMMRASLEHPNAGETLLRLLTLLRAIAGRSVYLQALLEHPQAMQALVRYVSASSWLADFIAKHPIVIDELLDHRNELQRDRAALLAEIKPLLNHIDIDDLGTQMDVLRQFKQTHTMRVAAFDVDEHLPVMKVSDQLTFLAEALLEVAADFVWQALVKKHGAPACEVDGAPHAPNFAIIAYGKLGGIELGYGSDLDIVFLHDSQGQKQQTQGPKAVDNGMFFARLAQKLVHFLNTTTPAGVLYEADTRLRPNGQSGLLVSSLSAFASYQAQEAWTWEHQALVRARVVLGSEALKNGFENVRRDILCRVRDEATLRREVREMRDKMRTNLDKSQGDLVDVKQVRGGVADIEFMVQYLVLRWAHDHPSLVDFTDNVRLLEALAHRKLLPEEECRALTHAYLYYRDVTHQAALQGEKAMAYHHPSLDAHLQAVGDSWQRLMHP